MSASRHHGIRQLWTAPLLSCLLPVRLVFLPLRCRCCRDPSYFILRTNLISHRRIKTKFYLSLMCPRQRLSGRQERARLQSMCRTGCASVSALRPELDQPGPAPSPTVALLDRQGRHRRRSEGGGLEDGCKRFLPSKADVSVPPRLRRVRWNR